MMMVNTLKRKLLIIKAVGDEISKNVKITGVCRQKSRNPEKPGLVKISFENTEQRNLILRINKGNLKNGAFKDVFLSKAKSFEERLIEMNARSILRHLPNGPTLRVNSNGRILMRQDKEETPTVTL
ncbi:hypothetical protein SNE40_021091 [Patella caerulea]|uniref:Uncharacterized protein n=1 Tax=Patella caerulea TaxID=87958 RepID=A0AAN8G131_PATCE